MGRISDEDIRRVREATDAVALISERVELKKRGRLYWGNCPFHDEKTPSFKIDPSNQLWHCFGCGAGGDVFKFVMDSDHLDFGEAVRMLADRAHIDIVETGGPGVPRSHRERLVEASVAARDFFVETLNRSREPSAQHAREYLGSRGMGSDVAKRWSIGFAPGRGAMSRELRRRGFTEAELVDANLSLRGDRGGLRDRFFDRVMFPINDIHGRTIAFGGRALGDGGAKYLNTQETPVFHKSANMYALDRAKASITTAGEAIVVEGYTDVIALHEVGITNVVATLGTALTLQHVRQLMRFANRIIYVFDGDAAGLRAADRASEFIDHTFGPQWSRDRIEFLALALPEGADPADFITQKGPDAFRDLLKRAEPILDFTLNRILDRWNLDRPEERASALREAAELLAPMKGTLIAEDYSKILMDRLRLPSLHTVLDAIDRTERRTPSSTADENQVAPVMLSAEEQLERRLLSMVATSPRFLGDANAILDEVEWSDPLHARIATGLIEGRYGTTPTEIVSSAEREIPGAGAILSGSDAGTEADSALIIDSLKRDLKEMSLDSEIRRGLARLRDAEGARSNDVLSADEYDRLFSRVVELQQELARLRAL